MSAKISIPYRGAFRGGDPREFVPDHDACTPEQIENWLAFRRIWAAADLDGEKLEPEPAQNFDDPENSIFGIGFQGTFDFETEEESTETDCPVFDNVWQPNWNLPEEQLVEEFRKWNAQH